MMLKYALSFSCAVLSLTPSMLMAEQEHPHPFDENVAQRVNANEAKASQAYLGQIYRRLAGRMHTLNTLKQDLLKELHDIPNGATHLKEHQDYKNLIPLIDTFEKAINNEYQALKKRLSLGKLTNGDVIALAQNMDQNYQNIKNSLENLKANLQKELSPLVFDIASKAYGFSCPTPVDQKAWQAFKKTPHELVDIHGLKFHLLEGEHNFPKSIQALSWNNLSSKSAFSKGYYSRKSKLFSCHYKYRSATTGKEYRIILGHKQS